MSVRMPEDGSRVLKIDCEWARQPAARPAYVVPRWLLWFVILAGAAIAWFA